MGQTPSKYFPWPTPYGQSPDTNVLMQAQAAPKAPLNNFIPLNQQTPAQPTQAPQAQNQFGGRRGIYDYGGGAQLMRNLYD